MRLRLAVFVVVLSSVLPADARAQLRPQPFASGFTVPLAFVQDPVNRNIQFVVQQNGHIRVIQNGAVLPGDFLDLSSSIAYGGEQGLLGMAFPPDTATSARFFVYFTNPIGDLVMARYKRLNATAADPSSRFVLAFSGPARDISIEHHTFGNHNGGNLVFGPDGYLYIGVGDGGSGNDPNNNAQNPASLLGKMLRVDVSVPDLDSLGYRVPSDNPFAGGGGIGARPEIWSFGLRNPWRYSFDDPRRGGTGALVIGDVGQGLWEEVDYEPANRGGRNYGWRIREGAHDNVTSLPPAFTPLVEPVFEYGHDVGQSITGGYVYRGAGLTSYVGRYFFADFIQGRIWSLAFNVNPTTREATAFGLIEHTAELSPGGPIGNVSSFGTDADGELYFISYSRGVIYRIAPVVPPPAPTGLRIVPEG